MASFFYRFGLSRITPVTFHSELSGGFIRYRISLLKLYPGAFKLFEIRMIAPHFAPIPYSSY